MPRSILIVCLVCFSYYGITACGLQKKEVNIEAVEVRSISPSMGETFYRVYYSGDLVMYQSQYLKDSFITETTFDSSKNMYSNNLTLHSEEWKDRFFVFHKDSSYGYNYDFYRNKENNQRLPVDSVVRFIKGTNKFEDVIKRKPDSVFWNANKSERKEVYLFPAKGDDPNIRLILSYSKNLNNVKESISSVVDSVKKMKLYKTETILDQFYSEKDKMTIPSLRFTTELKQIAVDKPDSVLIYLNRYRKSIGR